MPYYSESASYWYQVKEVGVVPARFAPNGLHKLDAASDWLLTKRLAGSSDTKLIGQHKQSA